MNTNFLGQVIFLKVVLLCRKNILLYSFLKPHSSEITDANQKVKSIFGIFFNLKIYNNLVYQLVQNLITYVCTETLVGRINHFNYPKGLNKVKVNDGMRFSEAEDYSFNSFLNFCNI